MKETNLKRLYVVGFHFYAILERATEIRAVDARDWGVEGHREIFEGDRNALYHDCCGGCTITYTNNYIYLSYICEFNLISKTTSKCEGYY